MTKLEKRISLLNRAKRLEKRVRQMLSFTDLSVRLLVKAQQLRAKAQVA